MAASDPADIDVPWLAPAPAWPGESLMVTFAFHCNLACTFCMVEDSLNGMPATSLAAFKQGMEYTAPLAANSSSRPSDPAP